MTLAPGTTVGRYQILEPLGQGGMATVYKAYQPSLQREVALKVLRPGYAQDQEFRGRFEREAIAIAKLRHPHIVQVFDFEIAPSGEYVLAMEFLEGGTLKDRLTALAEAGRGIEPRESVRILGEVAEALSYAHEKGVVHRDVKPSNVMLTQQDRAVVTDFGIARILGATSHTQTGVGIGTPEYMAPEQGQGTGIDHRADIYSLGAMAYELLTGRVPYLADTPLAVVLAHIKDPLPLPSKVNLTIGKGVERALLRALAKDPAARFDSATAFAEALRAGLAEDSAGGTMPTIVVGAAAAGGGTRSATASPAAHSVTPRKQVTLSIPPVLARRPIVTGVATALVLAVVVGGVVAGNAFRIAPQASSPPLRTVATVAPAGSAATTAASVATASAEKPPKFAIPAKGALIADIPLDPTGSAFRGAGQPPTPNRATINYQSGAVEFSIPTANSGVFTQPTVVLPSPDKYVVELEWSIPAGSDLNLDYVLRQYPNGSSLQSTYGSYALTAGIDALSSHLPTPAAWVAMHQTPSSGAIDALTTKVSDVRTGRTVVMAVVADHPTYTLFVDQKQIGRATVPVDLGATQPLIHVQGNSGAARLVGLRYYALP